MVVLSDMLAAQMFDPTVDSRPPTTIQEYDDIIERFIRLVFFLDPLFSYCRAHDFWP
jgi:hypothetical protein